MLGLYQIEPVGVGCVHALFRIGKGDVSIAYKPEQVLSLTIGHL